MKSIIKNFVIFPIYLILIIIIALEVILRVYNPFATRVKGYDIVLPVKERYIIEMGNVSKFESKIIHTKNSLGFRGEEKPRNLDSYLSIITVGGSTTECYYNSDSLTWSYLLDKKIKQSCSNTWLNNAGLNGHSTFGHQVLLNQYLIKIKPKVLFFLIGINDVGREELNGFDSEVISNKAFNTKEWFLKNSELANIILNLKRSLRAKRKLGLSHDFSLEPLNKMPKLTLSEKQIQETINQHKKKFVIAYRNRVKSIVEICLKNNIVPILITQPLLYGSVKDPLTGVDLAKVKTNENQNGELYWETLQLYNDEVRKIGKESGIFVIDLANEMPKNSLYFYDSMHFTSEGNVIVSDIIYKNVAPFFKNKFTSFCK